MATQAKYPAPLKTRIKPMDITDRAATRSPKNLTLKDKREAGRPAARRAGIVPAPKEIRVKKPTKGLEVVAALTIIAQESMQGKKPTVRPRINLEAQRGDRNRSGIRRPKNEWAPHKALEKMRAGMILKSTNPNPTIKIPPPRVRLPRRPENNSRKLAK